MIMIGGIALVALIFFVLSTPGQLLFRGLSTQEQAVTVNSGNSYNSVKKIAPPQDEAKNFKVGLRDEQTEEVKASAEPFIIKTSDLSKKLKYFKTRTTKNAEISFFAALGNDGKPRVAFDACDVCYRSKKGYSQNGDLAVCNNCGNRYPIDSLGTENLYGGCWPSYLHVDIQGNEIIIDRAEIQKKEYMFL